MDQKEMNKIRMYKDYFENASDRVHLVMHRGYALNLIKIVEALQKENMELRDRLVNK